MNAIIAHYTTASGAHATRAFSDEYDFATWLMRQKRAVTVKQDAEVIGGVEKAHGRWVWWYDPGIFAPEATTEQRQFRATVNWVARAVWASPVVGETDVYRTERGVAYARIGGGTKLHLAAITFHPSVHGGHFNSAVDYINGRLADIVAWNEDWDFGG